MVIGVQAVVGAWAHPRRMRCDHHEQGGHAEAFGAGDSSKIDRTVDVRPNVQRLPWVACITHPHLTFSFPLSRRVTSDDSPGAWHRRRKRVCSYPLDPRCAMGARRSHGVSKAGSRALQTSRFWTRTVHRSGVETDSAGVSG